MQEIIIEISPDIDKEITPVIPREIFNPLTPKTIEIPLTPKTPFGDATLGGYCGDSKCDKIFIIFNDTRSRIDLNWRLIIFF